MKFRELNTNNYLWIAGPARINIHRTVSLKKDRKWKMSVHWGGLESVGMFDTREEAEKRAKKILNDHIRKILEEIEE